MDGSITELIAGTLVGGIGKYIIDHFIKYRRYNAEVQRFQIESDGMVSGHWKILVEKLTESNQQLQLRVDKLEIENQELKEKYISLQHQISFGEKIK